MPSFPFIGDLSRADVDVLAECVEGALSILEFGVGGSTQIFAQAADARAGIVSVDTDNAWIERTRDNLRRLGIVRPVEFVLYPTWLADRTAFGQFDLAFDDGEGRFRLQFAMHAWERLSVGGKLLLHDTRRRRDMRNVLRVLAAHAAEVESALFNYRNSNITVLTKRVALRYQNWNVVEGKAPWEYGIAPPPDDAFSDRFGAQGESSSEGSTG